MRNYGSMDSDDDGSDDDENDEEGEMMQEMNDYRRVANFLRFF